MGGTSEPLVSSPDNGVLLCLLCHEWVESHREQALADGWLLQKVSDIGVVPVRGSATRHGVSWLGDPEVDVGDESGDTAVPPSGVGDLSDRSASLVGEEPDEVGLSAADVLQAFDGVVDAVEVSGEGGDGG